MMEIPLVGGKDCLNGASSDSFRTGTHIITAEIVGFAAACLCFTGWHSIVRRSVTVLSLTEALLLLAGAAVFAKDDCAGTPGRAVLEFFMRAVIVMLLNLSLFTLVMPKGHFNARWSSVGVSVFRGAALISWLALTPSISHTSRLQWATYSLQNQYSLLDWSSSWYLAGVVMLLACSLVLCATNLRSLLPSAWQQSAPSAIPSPRARKPWQASPYAALETAEGGVSDGPTGIMQEVEADSTLDVHSHAFASAILMAEGAASVAEYEKTTTQLEQLQLQYEAEGRRYPEKVRLLQYHLTRLRFLARQKT
jgi:hypothetical protein